MALEEKLLEIEITIFLKPNPDGTLDLNRAWSRSTSIIEKDGEPIGGTHSGNQENLTPDILSGMIPDRADLVSELSIARARVIELESLEAQASARVKSLTDEIEALRTETAFRLKAVESQRDELVRASNKTKGSPDA